MRIWIEEKEISIFQGAKVADALRSFSEKTYAEVMAQKKNVCDGYGNQTELDGELSEGSRLFIR